MGGLAMEDLIFCCNKKHSARVFDIPVKNNSFRSVLLFLDECSCCGSPVAIIKNIDKNLNTKTVLRRTGPQAIQLFNKYRKKINHSFKSAKGSKTNMNWIYHKNGRLYDLNGTLKQKVC